MDTNFVYKAIGQEVVKCSEILVVYLVDLCLFMALQKFVVDVDFFPFGRGHRWVFMPIGVDRSARGRPRGAASCSEISSSHDMKKKFEK